MFGLDLGVTGAALATLTGTVVGAGFMAGYGRSRFGDLRLLRRDNLRGWRELAPRLWRIGWPECTMLLLGYGIEVALVALVAQLGAVPVAANRLIENVTLISFTALVASGTGVTVLVGQRLGAGDLEGAAAYRAVGLRLSALLAGVPLIPVLLAPGLVFGLFTPDPEVVAAASSVAVLAVVALVPLVFAINLGGVLRAAGDTRTVLVASVAGDAFLVPLAWLLAISLGLGLRGLMLAWVAYGLVFVAVSWWRYHAGAWRTSTALGRLRLQGWSRNHPVRVRTPAALPDRLAPTGFARAPEAGDGLEGGRRRMAVDTFMAYVGVYPDVADADADYELVKDLHTEAGLIDAYDAAVIERRADGKVKITRKHETPTRVGGVLGGGVGLATGLVIALFPFAGIGAGLLAATTAGGAVLGAVAGHAAAGMSRDDLKELGEHLDAGQAGLVVVAVSDMGAKVEQAMRRAEKLEAKQLKADNAAIEADAKDATA